jgi:hypothetical protein
MSVAGTRKSGARSRAAGREGGTAMATTAGAWCASASRVCPTGKSSSAVRAGYPSRLSWAQCQDFLRRSADQLVDHHDLKYWQFFINNTIIERRAVPQLPPPPGALLQLEQTRTRRNSTTSRVVWKTLMRGRRASLMRSNRILR